MTDSQETARKIRQKTVGTSLRVSCPNGCGTTAAPLRNGVAAPEDALSAEKHGGAADVRSSNRFRLSNESLFSVCALGASWVDGNHATERFILKPLRRVCHVRHADYHHLLDLPARFHRYRGVRHRQIQSLVFLPPVWKGPARHRLRGAFCVRRRSDAVRTTAKRGLAHFVSGDGGAAKPFARVAETPKRRRVAAQADAALGAGAHGTGAGRAGMVSVPSHGRRSHGAGFPGDRAATGTVFRRADRGVPLDFWP